MEETRVASIIGFYGYSGSGKTTLINHLIMHFRERGLSIGVIKISDKVGSVEEEGKDTALFRQSGAMITGFSSKSETNIIVNHPKETLQIIEDIKTISVVDLIFVEGARLESIVKIRLGKKPLRANTVMTYCGDIEEVIQGIEKILQKNGDRHGNKN